MQKPDWIIPDWPVPGQVRALCSTREGGVSEGAWSSLNLGDHVLDDPRAVQANRRIFAAALEARPVFLQQVHGTHVQRLDRHLADGAEADASVTREQGVACVVMVADCLPVLFTNAQGSAVAAAHAGWRGLAAGVLETTARSLDGEVIAWLGPCIGRDAFEVGPEVREAFCLSDAGAEQCFTAQPGGKFLADLAGLARRRLRAAGVTSLHGNDSGSAWCTVSNPSRFFSYRRDHRALGASGRFAAAVWLAR